MTISAISAIGDIQGSLKEHHAQTALVPLPRKIDDVPFDRRR